jgi:iron complex transport system substrate-binding protein
MILQMDVGRGAGGACRSSDSVDCRSELSMRVISLLASATEIVCALGAGEMLVGRSHECDNPEWVKRLPACSGPAFDISGSSGDIDKEVRRRVRGGEPLYHVHADLIRDLHADLLISQSHCDVCAVTPADVNRTCGHATRQLALDATSVEDILQSMLRISHALGLHDRGAALVRQERERLARVKRDAAGLPRPSVIVLEWADPVFVAANWAPELVEIANGELLLSHKGEHSFAIAGEHVRDADPEFLIVAPCGFGLDRTLQEKVVLERYSWWAELRAVKNGKVAFADGNLFFNRSGMTVTQTAEIIAEILHGLTFGEATEGRYWQWITAAADRNQEPLLSKPA